MKIILQSKRVYYYYFYLEKYLTRHVMLRNLKLFIYLYIYNSCCHKIKPGFYSTFQLSSHN